jgi:dimethylhistidine N-methyltransferase
MNPDEIREYLARTPRQLPSKYFYDELGSSLFEAICRLPWYAITRAESGLLTRHTPAILAPLRAPITVAELGVGSGDKLAILADRAGGRIGRIQLVDISRAALDMASHRLQAAGHTDIVTHQHTYEQGLACIARKGEDNEPLLILFLGSNIGNFDPPVAHQLLVRIRSVLHPGDALLLGSDLVKPETDLVLAYDDPLQVTAAFNRNLLRRVNDELGGDFALEAWAHRAVWNAAAHRVEMHLVSRRPQRVRIAAAGVDIAFAAGEWIWTESSHKYERDEIVAHGRRAGFGAAEQWIDEAARFALTRFLVEEAGSG